MPYLDVSSVDRQPHGVMRKCTSLCAPARRVRKLSVGHFFFVQPKIKKRLIFCKSPLRSSMPTYGFGPFVLDVAERLLWRDSQRIDVAGKTFDVLRLLVEAQGRLVERETFNGKLWPDVTVEDRN